MSEPSPFAPIFPGMDPFIEGQRWPDFHQRMITKLADALSKQLAPLYDVAAEKYIYLGTRPDVSVYHRGRPGTEPATPVRMAFSDTTRVITPTLPESEDHKRVEIRDENGELITVIELLSPSNKTQKRQQYIANRSYLMYEGIHLVEIDLLRRGQRMEPDIIDDGYAILVARAQPDDLPRGELYEIGIQDALPVVPVPLKPGDPDTPLNLPGIFRQLYIDARYRLLLNYDRPPARAFSPEDEAWVKQHLEAAKSDEASDN